MADSTTNVTQIEASQAQKEVTANGLFDAFSPASYGGRHAEACSGLTWGYYGGRWNGDLVANGTLTLDPSTDNYIVVDLATGDIILANDSPLEWYDTGFGRLYKVITGASTVTSWEDHRPSALQVSSADPDLVDIAGLSPANDDIIQRKSGAWTNRTVAQYLSDLRASGLDADAAGFRGIPQNSQSSNYTTVAADAGKHLLHPSGGGSGDTFTIDSNANVAYEIGTTITFVNLDSNAVSIAITSDTLTMAGSGSTGTRQLAQYGVATALKVGSTDWLISGTGLS